MTVTVYTKRGQRQSQRSQEELLIYMYLHVYMLWLHFILGVIFIFFCFKLITTHYHTQKQEKYI